MRISDWSSDVCSSDLRVRSQPKLAVGLAFVERGIERDIELRRGQPLQRPRHVEPRMRVAAHLDSPLARREVEVQQRRPAQSRRSEEHTSELQSLMRISYAVFCLKTKKQHKQLRPLHYSTTSHTK